jgi:CubicO group peptidase (beta-lactamase class C family)
MRTVILLLTLLLAALPAAGRQLPATSPESVGLSSARLQRLDKTMQEIVDTHRAAGIVTILVRDGKVAHWGAYGKRDIEANAPMQKDTIFRIASMSKAVTSIAIMMLVEEGKLVLSDPVSKFIPSFKKTTVIVPPPPGAIPGSPASIVPAKREITIHDLLTHTAGIGYGGGPAEEKYKAANVHMWYFADKAEPIAAVIDRLAARRSTRSQVSDSSTGSTRTSSASSSKRCRARASTRSSARASSSH